VTSHDCDKTWPPHRKFSAYTRVLSTSGKVYDWVPREKLWGVLGEHGVDGRLLLPVKSSYSCSEVWICVDGINHNGSPSVLDSYKCVLLPRFSSAYTEVSKLWPSGQIRPDKPFHSARKDILSAMENEYLRIFVVLVEYNMIRNNHIT